MSFNTPNLKKSIKKMTEIKDIDKHIFLNQSRMGGIRLSETE